MKDRFLASVLVLFLLAPSPLLQAFDAGLTPPTRSRAYQQYKLRPRTPLSRILYLIDRFREADIEVIYDGMHYPAGVAASIARWFLSIRYEGQSEEVWIAQYCDRSLVTGRKIWVKDRRGEMKHGSLILREELERLGLAETMLPGSGEAAGAESPLLS